MKAKSIFGLWRPKRRRRGTSSLSGFRVRAALKSAFSSGSALFVGGLGQAVLADHLRELSNAATAVGAGSAALAQVLHRSAPAPNLVDDLAVGNTLADADEHGGGRFLVRWGRQGTGSVQVVGSLKMIFNAQGSYSHAGGRGQVRLGPFFRRRRDRRQRSMILGRCEPLGSRPASTQPACSPPSSSSSPASSSPPSVSTFPLASSGRAGIAASEPGEEKSTSSREGLISTSS